MSGAAFLPQEIIRAKRDGAALHAADIAAFIAGLCDERVSESQAAAFAMAVFFRGMTLAERVALTQAMARSGATLDWRAQALNGPALDKHSTGGIGDATSLVVAPLVAACGGYVPMISGRGLGHTGGTLDKLDAIPGYRSQPDLDAFRRVVREVGCAVIGQTGDLAPADRRLYAIRDVTATVESIPLITASILSKKFAAGLDGLVMDVKTGGGAFMTTREAARDLADSLAQVAGAGGLPTVALVTDMNEPLGSAAGAALETRHAIDMLTGARRDPRFAETTLALAAEMLVLGRLAGDLDAARGALAAALDQGAAAERFARMVAALGGPADLIDAPERHLPRAPTTLTVTPATPGRVLSCDARAIGLAVVGLGGGRTRPQDAIDPRVGFERLAGIGDAVGADHPLGVVHAADAASAERAAGALRAAYVVGEGADPDRGPVRERRAAPLTPRNGVEAWNDRARHRVRLGRGALA
ncbi:MAG: thymidine phosphorylase [Rhodoblastus sp.]|nr:MAG: thymidine phosphorylase [Rhodoblastus sp.]